MVLEKQNLEHGDEDCASVSLHENNGESSSESGSSGDENSGGGNLGIESSENCGTGSGNEDDSGNDGAKEEDEELETRGGSDTKERSESGQDSEDDSDDPEHTGNDSTASGVTSSHEVQSVGSPNDQSQNTSTSRSSPKSPQRASDTSTLKASGETALFVGGEDETDAGTASRASGSNTDSSDKGTLDSDQDHSSEAEDDTPAQPEDVASHANLSPVQDVDAEGQATATVETSELVMPDEVTVTTTNVLYSPSQPGEQRDAESTAGSPSAASRPDERATDEKSTGAVKKDEGQQKQRKQRGTTEELPTNPRAPAGPTVTQGLLPTQGDDTRGAAVSGVGNTEVETSSSDMDVEHAIINVGLPQVCEEDSVVPRTEQADQNNSTSGEKLDKLSLQEAFNKIQGSKKKADDETESVLEKFIADKVESLIKEMKEINTSKSCDRNPEAGKSTEKSNMDVQGASNPRRTESSEEKVCKIESAAAANATDAGPVEACGRFDEILSQAQQTTEPSGEVYCPTDVGSEVSRTSSRTGTRPKNGKSVSFYTASKSGRNSPQTKTKASVKRHTHTSRSRVRKDNKRTFSSREANEDAPSNLHLAKSRLSLDLVGAQSERPQRDEVRFSDQSSTSSGRQALEHRGRLGMLAENAQPDTLRHERYRNFMGAEANIVESQGHLTLRSSTNERNDLINSPSSDADQGPAPQQELPWEATGARPRTSRLPASRQQPRSEPNAPPTLTASVDKSTSTANIANDQENLERDVKRSDDALRESLVRLLNIGSDLLLPSNGPARRFTPETLDLDQSHVRTEVEGILRAMSNERTASNRTDTRTIAEIVHRSDGTSRYLVTNGDSDPLEEFVVLSRRRRRNNDGQRRLGRSNTRLTPTEQALPPIKELFQEEEREDDGVENYQSTSFDTRTKIYIGLLVLVLGTCIWRVRARY